MGRSLSTQRNIDERRIGDHTSHHERPPASWQTIVARTAGLLFLVTAVVMLSRCTAFTPRADRPAPGSPGRSEIETLLARASVVSERPDVGGYERDCGSGDGCVFGPAWSDATTAPLSHNGCDTRNDVLDLTLTRVRYRPGTGDCVVIAGVLADPYTGHTIEFRKSDAVAVQIDHVYPLKAAWDMGAHGWTPARRHRFANDVAVELIAVDGDANQRKSDGTPQDWIPQSPAYRCYYAAKYLTVAVRYSLPITAADHDVLADIAQRCA